MSAAIAPHNVANPANVRIARDHQPQGQQLRREAEPEQAALHRACSEADPQEESIDRDVHAVRDVPSEPAALVVFAFLGVPFAVPAQQGLQAQQQDHAGGEPAQDSGIEWMLADGRGDAPLLRP